MLTGFFEKIWTETKTFAHNFFFIYLLLHISFTIQLKCFTSHFFSMKTVQSHFFITSGVNWQTDFPVQATRFLIGANAQSLTCGYVPDRGWSLTKVSQRLFFLFCFFYLRTGHINVNAASASVSCHSWTLDVAPPTFSINRCQLV